jgi:hypothetical protein
MMAMGCCFPGSLEAAQQRAKQSEQELRMRVLELEIVVDAGEKSVQAQAVETDFLRGEARFVSIFFWRVFFFVPSQKLFI